MNESNYNPYDHLAILMSVLGNGYPPVRIWDWEVMPHPLAQEWLTVIGRNDS